MVLVILEIIICREVHWGYGNGLILNIFVKTSLICSSNVAIIDIYADFISSYVRICRLKRKYKKFFQLTLVLTIIFRIFFLKKSFELFFFRKSFNLKIILHNFIWVVFLPLKSFYFPISDWYSKYSSISRSGMRFISMLVK